MYIYSPLPTNFIRALSLSLALDRNLNWIPILYPWSNQKAPRSERSTNPSLLFLKLKPNPSMMSILWGRRHLVMTWKDVWLLRPRSTASSLWLSARRPHTSPRHRRGRRLRSCLIWATWWCAIWRWCLLLFLQRSDSVGGHIWFDSYSRFFLWFSTRIKKQRILISIYSGFVLWDLKWLTYFVKS